MEAAIRSVKRGKAVRINLIKYMPLIMKKLLLEIFNQRYRSAKIAEDFMVSTFIPIPRKNISRKCSDHCAITIMSYAIKLLLTIINRRIENRIDAELSETQYGFRKKRETRDTISLFKTFIQRATAINRKIYICYVDYEKAFDKYKSIGYWSYFRSLGSIQKI